MNEVTLIGIDLGKHVFHLRAQDAKGNEVLRKKVFSDATVSALQQSEGGDGSMEACAGAHWLARKLNELVTLPRSHVQQIM
nr:MULTISPECIES: hypothetical protein [unclassified Paraburkholderia]